MPPPLTRKVAAVAYGHNLARFKPPHRPVDVVVLDTLSGIRRARTTATDRRRGGPGCRGSAAHPRRPARRPIRPSNLELRHSVASALRCSGQAALDVVDLAPEARGLRVTIRPSKTDQASCGITIAVPSGAAVARTRRHQGRPRVSVSVDQHAPCARPTALRPECPLLRPRPVSSLTHCCRTS